jgi:hypothetical protein
MLKIMGCRLAMRLALLLILTLLLNCAIAIQNTEHIGAAESDFDSVNTNLCNPEIPGSCVVDNEVGTKVIYEDATVRVWNMTLAVGETTSMHRHKCGYHFLAVTSSELEVWTESGLRLMTITPKVGEVLGFSIEGDSLVQTASSDPIRIPRTHAARNIGPNTFTEILFESKFGCKEELLHEEF